MKAGVVAGIALIIVYGGLTYLGATLSNIDGNTYGVNTPQASLMVVITNGKLKYGTTVIMVCLFSFIVSNFGVRTIIKFSSPTLEIVYPVLTVLVTMSLVCGSIKNDNVFKGAALATFIVRLLSVANSLWGVAPIMTELPLASFGFNWIVPSIIGALIGSCIKTSVKTTIYEVE